ncbi:molybdenum cofactor guanylyltransferase [Bacillus nitroreducens]
MTNSTFTGIVLAGGQSRRFGSHKAFAKLHQKYFYEYAIKALAENVDSLYIVSHPDLKEQFEKQTPFQVVQDVPEFQGCGPLAGMFTVMKKGEANWYVIIPCDTPFVTDDLVKQLMSFTNDLSYDAIVPIIYERKQPLIAVYHARVVTKIERLLKKNFLKMSQLLEVCKVKYLTDQDLDLQGMEFENINNQTEFNKITQVPFPNIRKKD